MKKVEKHTLIGDVRDIQVRDNDLSMVWIFGVVDQMDLFANKENVAVFKLIFVEIFFSRL
jgi:hypothetical protein